MRNLQGKKCTVSDQTKNGFEWSDNRCYLCYLNPMPAHPAPMQIDKTRKEIHAVIPEIFFLIFLAFPESIRVFLERAADELRLLP